MWKSDIFSEKEKDYSLEGIKILMFDLTEKKTSNIERVVGFLNTKKDKKDDSMKTHWGEDHHSTPRVIIHTKVPTWTRDLSLETYVKQIETWSKINKDSTENTKYQDIIYSLNTNKEVKGLPYFCVNMPWQSSRSTWYSQNQV